MTPDKIRKLRPCPATNELVAKALGHEIRAFANTAYIVPPSASLVLPYMVPWYSDDSIGGWAASRECWEWLLCRGWLPTIDYSRRFMGKSYCASAVHDSKPRLAVGGDSLPHALALLVLLVAQAEGVL